MLGDFQNRHSHFKVFKIGVAVAIEAVQRFLLLFLVLPELLVIKLRADPAVDLVVIEFVYALGGNLVLPLEFSRGFFSEGDFIGVSFFQSILNPREHTFYFFVLLGYGDYGVGYLNIDIFLLDPVCLRAVFIMVAMPIPVAFLYLPGNRAAALIAFEHALKQRIMLACPRRAVAMQSVLDLLEQFLGDKRFVIAFGDLIFPAVHAVIKRIADELVDSGVAYLVSGPGPQTLLVHHVAELLGGVLSGGIKLEHLFYKRRFFLVRHVDFVSLVADGFIAERRLGW